MLMRMKYFLLILISILIIIRITMPFVILRYATSEINKIPDYKVKIADLDISLLKGEYTVKNIKLWKLSDHSQQPFLHVNAIRMSLQWQALLKGRFVAQVNVVNPVINLLLKDNVDQEPVNINKQWRKSVKSLFLVKINQIQIHNGSIYFQNLAGDPPFNLYIKKIEFSLLNMQEVESSHEDMPSKFSLTARVMDTAELINKGRFDPLARSPTFEMKASLKSLSLPALNSMLKHYTSIQVKSGEFSLFMEAAAEKGRIIGYAKPFIANFKIKEEKNSNVAQKIYEVAVKAAAKILKNSQQDTIASQIKIKGNINDPDASVLSIILYLLRHSFIQALLPTIDNKISMHDVTYQDKNQKHKRINPET